MAAQSSNDPNSMEFSTSKVYENRCKPGGLYDDMISHAVDEKHTHSYLGSSANTLGHTFEVIEGKTRPGSDWRTYKVIKTDGSLSIMKCLLVGEMRNRKTGTRMSAIGNFYVGSGDTTYSMRDGVNSKNVFMIGEPTNSPGSLSVLWNNQISEMNNISAKVSRLAKGASVTGLTSKGPDGQSLIKLMSENIYVNDKEENKSEAPASSKVLLTKDTIASLNDDNQHRAPPTPPQIDEEPFIRLGRTYPLNYFPDHVGPVFDQAHSSIVQHDVFDIKGQPVPPWELPGALRPGVVGLFEGYFNIWCPPNKNPIVQFICTSVRVAGESMEAPEYPAIPVCGGAEVNDAEHAHSKRSSAFESFGSNTKKARTTEDNEMDIAPPNDAIDWPPSPSTRNQHVMQISRPPSPTIDKTDNRTNNTKSKITAGGGSKPTKNAPRNKGKERAVEPN
ncbi:hypothetical protein CVT24_009830 [Panaeolus cyanescens]|uniref:Uncharacterized protein n=1 Tax=Panaeolus cyanescens TaxID=181874 RepID=A0A409WW70_9AGAR|nr:hypothetical protein CVT24_009830 [Panaeolus cyanescens]